MNTFKRKSLHVAVLAGLGAIGVAGSANAVHVNPDGLGQVLIYPYYTVRDAATSIAHGQYNTYISVTNTTASSKAVKVRFIEGKNSREVLDFNLFLSPFDVWTGSVEPRSANAADGARLVTYDKSCTWGNVAAAGATGVPFSNLAYSAAGPDPDAETGSLDRTNEGYVEIMEMGVINTATTQGAALDATIKHSGGVPKCDQTILSPANDTAHLSATSGYLINPTGGLLGGATLINTATGVDYAYDAVALDNWANSLTNPNGLGSEPTSLTPSIANGGVIYSDVFVNNALVGGVTQTAVWTDGKNAVSAAIMRNQVMNEYVLDADTASNTDWVVTFPTKRFYVSNGTGAAPLSKISPTATNRLFSSNFTSGGSCDSVTMALRDREEQLDTAITSGFSPAVGPTGAQLCWESNVITFGHTTTKPAASSILGSTNHYLVTVPAGYANGWMNLAFARTATEPSLTPSSPLTGAVHYGLPVVGLMVQDFINSTIVTGAGAAAGAAHGGQFVHKYTRDIR